MYQRRAAYPKGCPFTCGHYDGSVSYERGLCPVTEDLHQHRLVITDICKYPNTAADVDQIVTALTRILGQRDALRAAGHR
jgi:hypothetical protein